MRFAPGYALAAALVLAAPVLADDGRFLDLTRLGRPAATLVLPERPAPLWDDAVRLIASTAKRWGGAAPNVVRLAPDAPLPAGDLILLGTPETSAVLARRSRQTESPLSRVPFGDAHGFAV